jgi:hypothetical protein
MSYTVQYLESEGAAQGLEVIVLVNFRLVWTWNCGGKAI